MDGGGVHYVRFSLSDLSRELSTMTSHHRLIKAVELQVQVCRPKVLELSDIQNCVKIHLKM